MTPLFIFAQPTNWQMNNELNFGVRYSSPFCRQAGSILFKLLFNLVPLGSKKGSAIPIIVFLTIYERN